ncbi:rab proteins geranylgeranyltransferase component A 2-like isoform X2 [Dinothrombium tinctorium]|uniref:Rab proteins geranylgeranyltransferase component A n=1 Tax=Dinothrombium tinctorium TaxID=1965070 RepID=A0A443R773_9ACAR|nr:rab proteins geranylgeranyltransferase component A 2-like isoform X2 [Dinothrombium tinctorium]
MELDDHFDLVVVGTGVTESIVAAAAARVGKSVLHLDANDHYGNEWASLSFSQINEWCKRLNHAVSSDQTMPDHSELSGEESIIDCSENFVTIFNCSMIDYSLKEQRDDDGENPNENRDRQWTFEKLTENDRRFSIDLCPRLLFSRGSMVDILVQSNISRYLEFKPLTRLLSYLKESRELIDVPCSRADVFSNKLISVIEKRILMRFMTECIDQTNISQQLEGFEERPFKEFLKSKDLSEVLQQFIINAVAMVDENETTENAMVGVNRFLSSLGRFGNTPFILPLYGSGEIPQAFCRLCAVFGGTYCLKRSLNGIIVDTNSKVTHVITNNQRIKCEYLVTSLSQTPKCMLPEKLSYTVLSKAVFISNGSVKPSNKEESSFFRLAADEEIDHAVYVLEVGNDIHVAPKGVFIVYCWCLSKNEDAKKDLLPVAKKLFDFSCSENSSKPKLLWSCYYNQKFVDCSNNFEMKIKSAFVVSPPMNELDYDFAISEARQIFSTMFPDSEFLPRAPDPDEIVFDDLLVDASENAMH